MNITNNLQYVKDFFAKIPSSYIGNLAGRTVTYLKDPYAVAGFTFGFTATLLAAMLFQKAQKNPTFNRVIQEIREGIIEMPDYISKMFGFQEIKNYVSSFFANANVEDVVCEVEASVINRHIKNILQMDDDEDGISALENRQIINPKVETLVKNLPSSAEIPSEAWITTGFYKGKRHEVKCLNLTSFKNLQFNEFGTLEIDDWRHERTADWFKIKKHEPLKNHRFVAYQLKYINEFIFIESEDQRIKFLIRKIAQGQFIFDGNLLKVNPKFIKEQNEISCLKERVINKFWIIKFDENSNFKVLPNDIMKYIASFLYLV